MVDRYLSRFVAAAALSFIPACSNFLTGGELSNDPNRPTQASTLLLFVGTQANVFATHTQAISRISALFTQQISSASTVTQAIYNYQIDENSSSGLRQAYGSGGLIDLRNIERAAAASGDSVLLGVSQVQEALIFQVIADAYGDIVYTKALSGEPNPALDQQLVVFDSLQALLSRAIVNLSATGPTNLGPAGADVAYKGNAASWRALAYTLKARIYMHNAEVRGTASYQGALAAAASGIQTPAGDFKAIFNASSVNFVNPWNAITPVRGLLPDPFFDQFMATRADPRRTQYYTISVSTGLATTLSATRIAVNFSQPIATATENLLIWAEAAYRTGDFATALAKLNAERALVGLPAEPVANQTGSALLQEILSEQYINDFQLGTETWKLYRRTCFPNLDDKSPSGLLMPGRIPYDQLERLANSSMPVPGTAPNASRNQNDPANATPDVGGGTCKAGA